MIKKTANIFLAVILLAVSTGFNFNKHFCKDRLVKWSFYMPVKTCGMSIDGAKRCEKNTVSKSNCCKDESEFLRLKDNYVPEKYSNLVKVDFVPLHVALAYENDLHLSFDSKYLNYIPPPIEKDFSALFQSFLC